MKTFLIDAGNSSLKWSILSDNGALTAQQKVFYTNEAPLHYFETLIKKQSSECDALLMVSVLDNDFSKNAESITTQASMSFHNISSQKQLSGITNAYLEPHKLGADRFVAMIAAYQLINAKYNTHDKEPCIVIDAGTATTIDAIDKNGQHLGGLILPGTKLCSASLLENTVLLPQWNDDDEVFSPTLFSTETTQAIASASVLGLAGAVENICSKMANELLGSSTQPIKRVICGGDAKIILPFMESDYEYQMDLLMFGLKIIAQDRHI